MIKRVRSWWNPQDNKQQPMERPLDNVPEHVAIIMDGNGRWAKSHGLPRIIGHHNGMKAIKRATIAADKLGIKYLTLYAFSTENWRRPKDEVDFLMRLPQEFLARDIDELIEKNVRIRMMGNEEGLPQHTLSAMEEAERRTANNDGLTLTFAMNYGGRKEIADCMKKLGHLIEEGKLTAESISEETINQNLLTSGLPDPDLVIRTSGEMRVSNFMLWQIAYSEMWFTNVYWPEFNENHLYEAVAEYQLRTRRYGGLT